MSTAAIVAGTAAAGLAGAGISAYGANSAADKQVAAENNAQNLQATEAQNALDFNKQQYANTQTNEAPYLAAGTDALSKIQNYQPFQAPTALSEQNDPGYQARLQLGTDALQKSAAARGSVLTGGTAKALDTYAQDYASNEYGNVYNRAYGQYNDQYNRLAQIAGAGQATATSQAASGQAAANANSNIDLTTGAQQGADITGAGTAAASGIVGASNAVSGGLTGTASNLTNYTLLNNLSNSGYGGGTNYKLPTVTNELGAQV